MLKNCLILINVGKVHLCMTLIYKKICKKCKEILKFSKIVQTLNICNKIHTCYQNQVYGISKIYRCQKSNIQEFHMEFPISYQKIFQLIHAGVVVLKIQYSGKIYLYFQNIPAHIVNRTYQKFRILVKFILTFCRKIPKFQ